MVTFRATFGTERALHLLGDIESRLAADLMRYEEGFIHGR
jgi:hypothetical protein